MRLTVKNFGPIEEAIDIVVSPMTIFVGPSNTGKSYLAMLVYSITKILLDHNERLLNIYQRNKHDKIIEGLIKDIGGKKASINYNELLKRIQDDNSAIVDKLFLSWARNMADDLKGKIMYYFGEEGKKIIEEDDNLVIEVKGQEDQLTLNLSSPDKSTLSSSKKEEIITRLMKVFTKEAKNLGSHRISEVEERYQVIEHLLKRIYEESCENFVGLLVGKHGPYLQSHYLPAIRGGIIQGHRTLVSALIGRASIAGVNAQSLSLLNGIIADFMDKLISLSDSDVAERLRLDRGEGSFRRMYHRYGIDPKEVGMKTKEIKKIGDKIESRIIGGKIKIKTSEVDYPDFFYMFKKGRKNHAVPLMNASSMVSELAPVSLFIRHYVCYGDLLILEEPEAHLHSAAQLEIAKILAQLVDAGVYVLVITHSDYILEQIGNCILAEKVSQPDTGKKTLQPLKESDTSVYLFNRSKREKSKNIIVKEVQFDSETGIVTEDHLAVSSSLYNESVSLLNESINLLEAKDGNDD